MADLNVSSGLSRLNGWSLASVCWQLICHSKTNNIHIENACYFHFMHCKYERTWEKNNLCSHRKTKTQMEEKMKKKKMGSAGVIIWYSSISARDLKMKLSAVSKNSSWHYLYFTNIFLSNQQHPAFTDIKEHC